MTRSCAMLALLCVALPALAKVNWVRLGEDARATIYIDNAGIVRPQGFVKAWTLLSYKSRQRGGWLSEKRLFLFSCTDRSFEWQQSMYYREPMGQGELLQVRALTRDGVGDVRLVESDPGTKDPKAYRDAVPESRFAAAFASLC